MVQAEVDIVIKRVNNQIATEAILMQQCIASAVWGKEGAKIFNKTIKGLQGGK
ncbi:hypothetical protein [Salmonella phage SD-13_S19]|uniref:Uncharacterized protein n=1 Tax=Proteus phage pPM_01 TaxID=1567485 RepID=A0A0B4SKT1_9CAUD|nr:tail length tape measure protein [Proteus phage pPM_01]EKV7661831.1 hypothetical protein [Proteus mirabilis]UGO36016.1 putative tail assembly chaperone [Proteus phage vB_PmiS_Inception]UGO48768.1 hypothetical protein JING313_23 [Proteus phage vB_PmiS_Jing313]UGO49925.1 putative tail assembly chaperone [Proteus phage vB_PmiS_NotEvenPhaged]UGO51499.1 putative tail assembly chaperone [Proteus phage vB_PmiS_DanisaurMW]UGO51631.1 putative tail assembly chaperone [Proteus phage vB_PmiS_DoubleBar